MCVKLFENGGSSINHQELFQSSSAHTCASDEGLWFCFSDHNWLRAPTGNAVLPMVVTKLFLTAVVWINCMIRAQLGNNTPARTT